VTPAGCAAARRERELRGGESLLGDYRTPYRDDCLAPNEERAWSSPIFVGSPFMRRGVRPAAIGAGAGVALAATGLVARASRADAGFARCGRAP